MKGFKFLIAAALLAVTTSASAQFENTSEPTMDANKPKGYSLMAQKPIKEISLYIQDGWGLGLQIRKDINRYIAWNIVGASYMVTPINRNPGDKGQINFKLHGVRLYSPTIDKNSRFYADLNLGYTLRYVKYEVIEHTKKGTEKKHKINCDHYFGLDFGVGAQIGKHYAIGYNLNFTAPDKEMSHWAKISCLF